MSVSSILVLFVLQEYTLYLCHTPASLATTDGCSFVLLAISHLLASQRLVVYKTTLRCSISCFVSDLRGTMSQRRVCDACAVRRVRCDGLSPCVRCKDAELNCTRVRPRLKSGPKGVKKRTLDKLAKVQGTQSRLRPLQPEDLRSLADDNNNNNPPIAWTPPHPDDADHIALEIFNVEPRIAESWSAIDEQTVTVDVEHFDHPAWGELPENPYKITVDHLILYLDIYHHKLYPVWPIVNKDSLTARLCLRTPDPEAYILASSICIATILQLQLTASDLDGSLLQPELIMDEIESLWRAHDYREHPSLDSVRSSFFLHVAYLHVKKQRTSTLTLREAVSIAHMLDLHKASHYESLSTEDAGDHLRVLWLLFITER